MIKGEFNDMIDYCECTLAPKAHVHVSTHGELDEARQMIAHVWIVHDFQCQCLICIENNRFPTKETIKPRALIQDKL